MTALGAPGLPAGRLPGVPAHLPVAPAAAPGWPRTPVVAGLAGLAVVLAALRLLVPDAGGHTGPAGLAVATWAVGALVVRHGRSLDAAAAPVRRAFAVITALLGLGHAMRALAGVGVNPLAVGLPDVPLAATGPVAVLLCVRLVRSTGGRVRLPVALDGAVALVALGLLVALLLPSTSGTDPVLGVGYPAVSAVLCAAGLVTFAGVSAARRAAAGWLLVSFGSLGATMTSGALAAAAPSPLLDVCATTAYLVMLAAATLALAADPGPRARSDDPVVTVPLAGVVVSYCVGFGTVLVLLAAGIAGRVPSSVEAGAATVLAVLILIRTLVWVADTARLTRRVVRTEAWFRTLVHSAADVTMVLDHRSRITWSSGAGRGPATWTPRDLAGRDLADVVHAEDRAELARVLAGATDPVQARGQVLRLRTRDGGWRAFETVRVVPSAELQADPGGDGPDDGDHRGLVLHLRDVDERRSSELELHRLAYTDHLTGLPNRARLMAALASARSRAAEGRPSCLLLLDLDGFKAVNDVAGHEAGDLLLVEVAARLRATVRDRDLVGRLGGDEFAVLVAAGLEEATALAERIVLELRDVHRSVPTGGGDPDLVFDVSCSVGVTELDPADDVPGTVRSADLALRAAKAAGKDCVRCHGEAADPVTGRRTRLARDLPDALARGEMRVVYQPVVGLVERRVLGLEALLRWQHPVLGEVSPEEFVPLVEDDGLIVPLQRWVLDEATTALARLTGQGRDLRMGVNISVRHLQAGCLVPDVVAALGRTGLAPDRLMLEVTESLFIGERDRTGGDLTTLHDMGVVISLDDFGRGYSTFAYLARLPVDVLKMDREFLAGIEDDERGAALVHSVISLGRRLGIDVVAEGVETPGQLAALQRLGCRYLQGFLLGRPTEVAELAGMIDAFDADLLDVPAGPSARD